ADGERDVTTLWESVGAPQPTVSHHLSFLRLAHLVSARRDGRRVYYSLGPAARVEAHDAIAVEYPAFAVAIATAGADATSPNPAAKDRAAAGSVADGDVEPIRWRRARSLDETNEPVLLMGSATPTDFLARHRM